MLLFHTQQEHREKETELPTIKKDEKKERVKEET